jgi:glucose-6-phosphate 1-dehydrogenase
MSETLGVGNRIGFYDKNGVLKDVIQNHALQLLALIAMDTPKKLDKNYVRAKKAKVLKKTKVTNILLGQYNTYQKEAKKSSSTPTFTALKLKVNTSRFKGVPFYIKAGKNLNKKETTIHIKFKKVKCLLAQSCPTDTNYLTIRIQPDAGFSLELNSKVPRKRYDLTTVNMDFSESKMFGPNTPQAYEILFKDILDGDQSVFVRNDEIEYAWKIIDKIKKTKVYKYKKDTIGPTQLKQWSKNNNINWRS